MPVYVRPLQYLLFLLALVLLAYSQAAATSALSLLFSRLVQQASALLLQGRLLSSFIALNPCFAAAPT